MPSKRKLTNNNSPKKTRKSAKKNNRRTNTTTQSNQDVAAGAFADVDVTNLPSLHILREECKRLLILVKTTRNADVIDHFLVCLLLQMKFKVLLAIWAGLCPTPEDRGHESLGGAGRIDHTRGEDGEAATIRYMRFLDEVLPGPEDGGIESGGILSRSWWINAREICTNDGETCFRCKEYAKEEARDIGNALVIISKFIRLIGGKIVVMCAAGLSVKAERLFDILKKEGEFDGLSDYGTHGSFLGHKCQAWSKDEQCTVNAITLHGHDEALRPSFEAIGYTPPRSMLKTAQMTPELCYVAPRESDLTGEELAELRQAREDKALAQKEKKNGQRRERYAQKKQEAERIKAKPENKRSKDEKATLAKYEQDKAAENRQQQERHKTKADRMAAAEEAEKIRRYANDCREWFTSQGYKQRHVTTEPGKLGIGLANCVDYLRVKSVGAQSQLKHKVSVDDIIMRIDDVDVIHLHYRDAQLGRMLSAVENSKTFEIWTE